MSQSREEEGVVLKRNVVGGKGQTVSPNSFYWILRGIVPKGCAYVNMPRMTIDGQRVMFAVFSLKSPIC